MTPTIPVVAVLGGHAGPRLDAARRLAAATRSAILPAARLAGEAEPVDAALRQARAARSPGGVVVEFPTDTLATEVVAAAADLGSGCALRDVIGVLDAAATLDDLAADAPLPADHPGRRPVTRAAATIAAIEYASRLVLVGWARLPAPRLAALMALLGALAPTAAVRLDPDSAAGDAHPGYDPAVPRPGWLRLLNGAAPAADGRVSAWRYDNVRPFHPERLLRALHRIDAGAAGTLVRSCGFCRIATRPGVTAQWDQLAHTITLTPIGHDEDAALGGELLAIGQDLGLIGLDLDRPALTALLDEAALTDHELAAGPRLWSRWHDPLPAWPLDRGREGWGLA